MNKASITPFLCLTLLLTSESAFAYVGPGAGIGLLGAIFGLVVAIGTALWAVVVYPIRKSMKAKKVKDREDNPDLAEKILDDDKATEKVVQ